MPTEPSAPLLPLLCADGKPCLHSELVAQLQQQLAQLQEQVRSDALTGLYNYRFFSEILPLEMERARRSLQPLALILLDVDHFKEFNDRWGHEQGNAALAHIASIMRQTSRKLDFICRYGGEEFVVVLPNTSLRQGVAAAARLCAALAQTPLLLANGEAISLTASLGVDVFSGEGEETTDAFVNRVDHWLYHAKQAGRQQVKHPPVPDEAPTTHLTTAERDELFALFQEVHDVLSEDLGEAGANNTSANNARDNNASAPADASPGGAVSAEQSERDHRSAKP